LDWQKGETALITNHGIFWFDVSDLSCVAPNHRDLLAEKTDYCADIGKSDCVYWTRRACHDPDVPGHDDLRNGRPPINGRRDF